MTPNSSFTSTSSLTTRSTPPKDFQTAFGQLSSSYGFEGNAAPSLPSTPTDKFSLSSYKFSFRSNLTSPKVHQVYKEVSAQPSHTYIVDLDRRAATSKEALLSPTCSPKRDYQAAFGTLVSTYGFGGNVPALPKKRVKIAETSCKPYKPFWSSVRSSWKRSRDAFKTAAEEDSNVADGVLASSNGRGVNVPVIDLKRGA